MENPDNNGLNKSEVVSQSCEKSKVSQVPHIVRLRSISTCMTLHSSSKICSNYIIHLPFTGRRDEEARSLQELAQRTPVSISLTSSLASWEMQSSSWAAICPDKNQVFCHYEIKEQIFWGKWWSLLQAMV